ncbi:MAG TPA: hypothetical protein VHK69_10485 [Chitinophagaceae bacterium]|jgi:hypothetical protein|nr:hypothetical protein [Chitinophagaceae bacterium]
MKILALLLFLLLLCTGGAVAQKRTITLKWAPTGLVAGNIALQGEYRFAERRSLTAKIGVPLSTRHMLEYEGKDADFDMRAFSFLAGYRMYFSRKNLQGFYLEPFFKYVHHSSEGLGAGELALRDVAFQFTNDYNGLGVGAQLGVQFLVRKRLAIDLFFLGPEINSARNNFRAVEVSSALPWNDIEAAEARRDIHAFLDQFPFLGNRTDMMVDKTNRMVAADFKGLLPGWRAGVSFGVAF